MGDWERRDLQAAAGTQRSCFQGHRVLFAPKPLSAVDFHEELSLQLQLGRV